MRRSLGSRRCRSPDRRTRSRATPTRWLALGRPPATVRPAAVRATEWEQLDWWMTAERRSSSSSTTTTSGTRRADLAARHHRTRRPATIAVARRPQATLASRADRHARMLRRPRVPVLHRGCVTTPAGRARRLPRCSTSGLEREGERAGVLRRRLDAAHDPRQPRRPPARCHRRGGRRTRTGQLDLTITEQFARSMSVEEALSPTTCSVTR